jgi:hypothetical protein
VKEKTHSHRDSRTFASVESFKSVEAKKDFCLHLTHLIHESRGFTFERIGSQRTMIQDLR